MPFLPVLVVLLAAAGCWSDIQYDPANEGQTTQADTPASPGQAERDPESTPELALDEDLFGNEPTPEPEQEPDPEPEAATETPDVPAVDPQELFAEVPDAEETGAAEDDSSEEPVHELAATEPDAEDEAESEADEETAFLESVFGPIAREQAESDDESESEPVEEPSPEPESNIYSSPIAEPRTLVEPAPFADVAEVDEPAAADPMFDDSLPSKPAVSVQLPWETNPPPTATPPENTPPDTTPKEPATEVTATEETGTEETAPAASSSVSPLPWESPATAEETPEPPPAEVATADSPEWEPAEPTRPEPMDSRQLAWALGARLSYLLVAPDANVSDIEKELAPVAAALELELPTVTATEPDSADRLKQLLSVGHELGKSVADKYGMDHAALVEIAFKSNLLLAVAESRPQLKHSISGSVAAAAVRAQVPETVWQPFQDHVAESSDSEELANSVIELHKEVGNWLKQSKVAEPESDPPVLR